MTNNELSLAVAIAESDQDLETFIGEGSSQSLNDTFHGWGTHDFQPVTITIRMLAALVRHECVKMTGELCSEALNNVAAARRKFIIVGLGDDDAIAAIARCKAMVSN